MIKHVSIDGFKSLTNFELSLKPGLNILVGPNGSGKTNIVSFFEFLGDLQDMDVSSAICNSGGAGSVFTKIGKNAFKASTEATISGEVQISKKRFLYYVYNFNIGVRESVGAISYNFQKIQMKLRAVPTSNEKKIKDWDCDIEMSLTDEEKIPNFIISLDRRKFKLRQPFWRRKGEKLSKTKELQQISSFLSDLVGTEDSLITGLQYLFYEARPLAIDFRGGKVFNIVPSKAKIPEDSAKLPGINKDGSGLYATLYSMKKEEKYPSSKKYLSWRRDLSREIKKAKIDELLKYVHLANDAINKIIVFNDPFDNQIQIRIAVESEKESIILPLSAMSDGTIKWMSLITILLTSRTVFSIEEPENYLHPLMQAEIVSVMRTRTKNNMLILLTTHSETILNHAMPEEVVVTSFKNGKTIASRPSNSEELHEEIQSTGFGLGYYYLSGSLSNE